MPEFKTYIAFLRGINVGGHHKVPMADLRKEMEVLGLTEVQTILNSGNVIFKSPGKSVSELEKTISLQLKNTFGFTIPTLVLESDVILALKTADPFKGISVTKDSRLYLSFLREVPGKSLSQPWISEDGAFRIITIINKVVCSVLDLAISGSVKAMEHLEKKYGKDLTTRNWNTITKIIDKI